MSLKLGILKKVVICQAKFRQVSAIVKYILYILRYPLISCCQLRTVLLLLEFRKAPA